MLPAQIKTYVEIQSLAQLTQFKSVNGEQVVRAFQLTNRLKDNICNLLSALAGQRGPYLITGQRGAGKSHLMALIRALTMDSNLTSMLKDPAINTAMSKISNNKFFVIDLHLNGEEPPDLLSLLREELATREYSPLIFSDAEWEESMLGERIFKLIRSKLHPNTVMVLFIDGLSAIMRPSNRAYAQIKSWLLWLAERFRDQNQALIITMDEDLLDVELSSQFKVEYIDTVNLREIADRYIFKKNESQRNELHKLYNELQHLIPRLSWSREDFLALFPIHPCVLEVAPGVRSYSRSFTFFGFITAAASRATNRRATNLSTLDEVFDSFEFDLRKNEQLTNAFVAYDLIIHQGVPKLTGFDDRLWAKMALKALFIFSLTGNGVTAQKLSGSLVMLQNDSDFAGVIKKAGVIMDSFVEMAPDVIEVKGEGESRTYKFVLKSTPQPADILKEAADEIADDDPRLAEILIGIGGEYFSDWPLKMGESSLDISRAEIALPWRGTMRSGLLKYNGQVELLPIVLPEKFGSVNDGEEMDVDIKLTTTEENTGDDDKSLPVIEVLEMESVTSITGTSEGISPTVCEWDWQIIINPINTLPPAETPHFCPPTLFYWQSQRASEEDVSTLKQALALRLQKDSLVEKGLDCEKASRRLEEDIRAIFRHFYLDGGKLRNPGTGKLILIDSPPQKSTIIDFLAQTLSDGLATRYPEHPAFEAQLTEYEVLRLAVGLFGGLNISSPTVQSYAETYAAPLRIVSAANGEYSLDLDSDMPNPAVSEVMRMVDEADGGAVSMSEIYRTLRREPFGLQLPAQRLILLALIAAWQIELTDDTGSLSLGASQLTAEAEFKQYTQVRVPTNINYPPKLLSQWCMLLTGQEEEIDLVSQQGRRQVRDAVAAWRQNWVDLNLMRRLEDLPADLLTTRLWQITISCKRYFEAISNAINTTLNDEITLEMCLARIIDTFNAKEAIYIKAVNELTLLVNFLDWLPFYQESKNYILAAERTTDTVLETEKRELVGFLMQSHRLLDEEKRQRYHSVYKSFHSRYVDYYCALHDNIVGTQNLHGSLNELLSSDQWRAFELTSQLSVANHRYYRTALELVRDIKESSCQFPARDLLQETPFCACSFRINRTVDPAITLEILKEVVEQGMNYHQRLIAQQCNQISASLDSLPNEEAEKIKALLATATNGESHRLTLSAVEALNEVFAVAQPADGLLPAIRLGGRTTKQELRERFEHWLDSLPDETGVSLEFLDCIGFGDE
jgi:hypothetical protein